MRRNAKREATSEKQPEKLPEPKEEAFSLYKLLEVDRKATTEDIKLSYKKLALKTHPDKNKEDPEAKAKFAQLHEAYKILIDAEKRKQYDETGRVGGDFDLNTFEQCYRFFRNMFKPLTKQDITDFKARYVGGDMEKEDLIKFYKDQKGNMTKLLETIPLCTNDDLDRFKKFFEEQFGKGEIEENEKYKSTIGKVRMLNEPKPKKAASKEKKQKTQPAVVEKDSTTQPRKTKPADIGRSVPKRPQKKPAGKAPTK